MEKYTQRQLKNLVEIGAAEDITNGNDETRQELERKEGFYEKIGYSVGLYGLNGMLLKGHTTGKLYAITARTSAIFIF